MPFACPCRRLVPLLLLLASIACGAAAEETAAPPRQRIVYGSDHEWPPYEFLDATGRPRGFNVDLLRAIGEVMGLEVAIELGPWESMRHALEVERRTDVADMFRSEARDRVVDFTEPFQIVHDEIFVRRGSVQIGGLAGLAGRRVLVQAGSYTQEYFAEHPHGATFEAVESEPRALRLLASGQYDCAVVNGLVGRYTIRSHRLTNLTTTGTPILPRDYCLVVAEGRRDLLAQLDQGIAIVKATGRYDAIHTKWFGPLQPEPPSIAALVRRSAWILGPLVGLLAWFAVWTWLLRRRVARATRELRSELAERRQAQEAQERLTTILETTTDFVGIATPDGRVLYINKAGRRLLGMPPETTVYGTIATYHPAPTYAFLRDEAIPAAIRHGSWSGETALLRLDGREVPVSQVILAHEDAAGELQWISTICRDITQQQEAEERQKRASEALRELAKRLQAAREEERTGIAREIHDELGQALTGLKMDLYWLGKRLSDPEGRNALAERVSTMNQTIEETMQAVRRIATELRPAVLDELGLEAAIEWLVQEYRERAGTRCELHMDGDVGTLDAERSTAVFRILQEVLTNVKRHAHATSVQVRVGVGPEALDLEVQDDGRGIPQHVLESTRSLGLLGMRERAAAFGGAVTVRSAPGRGTTVGVRIPAAQGRA